MVEGKTETKNNKQKTVINMLDVNPTTQIISLNVNVLNACRNCQSELKNTMTQLYVVNKKSTLNIKIHMDYK